MDTDRIREILLEGTLAKRGHSVHIEFSDGEQAEGMFDALMCVFDVDEEDIPAIPLKVIEKVRVTSREEFDDLKARVAALEQANERRDDYEREQREKE